MYYLYPLSKCPVPKHKYPVLSLLAYLKNHIMKKLSIFLIAVGLLLMISGKIFYRHHQNADDSGGSASVTTINGVWATKIPAYFGGVMLLFGSIFLYMAIDDENKKHAVVR